MGIILIFLNTLTSYVLASNYFKSNFTKFLLSLWIFSTGQIVVYSTILSLVSQLNLIGFFVIQVLTTIVIISLWVNRKINITTNFSINPKLSEIVQAKFVVGFLIVIGILMMYNLLVAILLPPRNHDGLSYHLPRIVQWIQNNKISHFFTNDWRQNFLPQNSSILMLWTVVTTNGYNFVQTVQWISALFCSIGIYGLCRISGASRKMSIISGSIFLTLPMVVMQISTVQNDLVVTSYTVAFLYFFVDYLVNDRLLSNLITSSTALGLAVGTKYTIFFLFPGLLILLLMIKKYIKKCMSCVIIRNLIIIHFIGIMLFGSYNYILNYTSSGNIISSKKTIQENSSINNPIFNLTKYIFQMTDLTGIPNGLRDRVSIAQGSMADKLYNVIGVKKDLQEFNIRQGNKPYWYISDPHEDYAGFGVIGFMLITFGLFIGRKNKIIASYKMVAIIWFLVFSVLIPWTPYKTRYFILPMAILTTTVSTINIKKLHWKKLSSIILFLVSGYICAYVSINGIYKDIYSLNTNTKNELLLNAMSEEDRYAISILRELIEDNEIIGLQVPSDSREYVIMESINSKFLYAPTNNEVEYTLRSLNLDYIIAKGDNFSKGDWIDIPSTDWHFTCNDVTGYENLFDYIVKKKGIDVLADLLNEMKINNSLTLSAVELENLADLCEKNALIRDLLFSLKSNGDLIIENGSFLIKGLYKDGWSGNKIDLFIPKAAIDTHDEYLNLRLNIDAYPKENFYIEVQADNTMVYKSSNPNNEVNVILPAKILGNSSMSHIEVKVNTFVPSEISDSTDTRELGIILDNIEITRIPQMEHSINLLSGYFEWAGKYQDSWIGQKSSVNIPTLYLKGKKKAKLAMDISGCHPDYFGISIYYNNRLIGTSNRPTENFTYEFLLDDNNNEFVDKISIICKTFIPKEVDNNSLDERSLGVKVKNMVLIVE